MDAQALQSHTEAFLVDLTASARRQGYIVQHADTLPHDNGDNLALGVVVVAWRIITLRTGQHPRDELMTLAHEIAHIEWEHDIDSMKWARELQAELTAQWIVATLYGLAPTQASITYAAGQAAIGEVDGNQVAHINAQCRAMALAFVDREYTWRKDDTLDKNLMLCQYSGMAKALTTNVDASHGLRSAD